MTTRRLLATRDLPQAEVARAGSGGAATRVHFVGIGGVGMSGIAEVLCTLGYQVSGSDNADNADDAPAGVAGRGDPSRPRGRQRRRCRLHRRVQCDRTRQPGACRSARAAHPGRAARGDAGRTDALPARHCGRRHARQDHDHVAAGERAWRRRARPDVRHRRQLLAAGANARLGSGDWLVAEADESDGSFLRLNPLVAIVTNIDADHLENYGGDFARVQAAFAEFLHRLPFYGLAVLCIDDAEVAALAADTSRHIMTTDSPTHADVRAEDVRQHGGCMHFTLCLPDGTRTPIQLALPGRHNVQNALAAATVGWQLGVEPEAIARALQKFAGIGRRFNLLAQLRTAKGATVQLVDDYGHHPKELEAVFAAARGGWPDKRLVVAFQPHRYSRTRDLLDDFAGVLSSVDALVLTEVYPAGEAPIAGADAKSLARAIRARGRIDPVLVGSARRTCRACCPTCCRTATCCC